jgi:hypothetical protein
VRTMRSIAVLTIVALCSSPAAAIIDVFGTFKFTQQVRVRNNTGQPVTFVRGEVVCASQSPDSFTVAANGSAEITIEQKHWDTGLDDCYATHHTIAYHDSNNDKNSFRIQQYDNSDQWACLDIKYNIVAWINQAICPEAHGSVFGPVNDDSDPAVVCNNGICTPSCPPGAEYCPPSDDGRSVEYFGFVIENPVDFSVVVDNDTNGSLDCNLTDLANKTDRNECVTSQPTVGPSKTAITLKGSCGSNFYRPSDRTNVILLCYTSGTNGTNLQSWTPVTNGSTYVYLNK